VERALELRGATLLESGDRRGSGGLVKLMSIRKNSMALEGLLLHCSVGEISERNQYHSLFDQN
jgi:hypothetical protein